jgi:hypothetical protein
MRKEIKVPGSNKQLAKVDIVSKHTKELGRPAIMGIQMSLSPEQWKERREKLLKIELP